MGRVERHARGDGTRDGAGDRDQAAARRPAERRPGGGCPTMEKCEQVGKEQVTACG